MIELTPEEKAYIKKYVILDLEDRIGLPGNDPGEDELLFNLTGKLMALCAEKDEVPSEDKVHA